MSSRTAAKGAFAAARRRVTGRLLDIFDRTSTTTPGTAQTGQAWQVVTGTWGTDGARLYSVTATDGDNVLIETGTKTQDVTVTLALGVAAGAFPELVLRASTAASNGYWVEVQSDGKVGLVSGGGGVFTAAGAAKNGDVIRATATDEGSQVRLIVWVNGVQVLSSLSEYYNAGTKIGFRHGAASAGLSIRWDNLTVA